MRCATMDTDWISDGGETVGVALGYDGCAEHETGIKPIRAAFGLDDEAPGLDRYRVTRVPPNLRWITGRDREGKEEWGGFGIGVDNGLNTRSGHLTRWGESSLYAQWSKREFAVVGWTEEARTELKALFDAIQRKEAVITQGGPHSGNPFGGSGPCLMRTDTKTGSWADLDATLRTEQAAYEKWKAEWAVETEGLYEDLKKMGGALGGYTSTPWFFIALPKPDGSWTYQPKASTQDRDGVPVKLAWLNPAFQDIFRAGWYTSEDLRKWAVGDGPVWPLCAALPHEDHPFWKAVLDSVPSPDASRPRRGGWTSTHANLADVEGWQSFKGVGPKLAARIVAERENGPYTDAHDVRKRVEGIGPKLFERIRYRTHYTPTEWHPFPRAVDLEKAEYHVYLEGNDFWSHASKLWGFRLASPYGSRAANHRIFAKDREHARNNHFPVFGYITDWDLLSDRADEWNRENPDWILDFMIYGRGCASLAKALGVE